MPPTFQTNQPGISKMERMRMSFPSSPSINFQSISNNLDSLEEPPTVPLVGLPPKPPPRLHSPLPPSSIDTSRNTPRCHSSSSSNIPQLSSRLKASPSITRTQSFSLKQESVQQLPDSESYKYPVLHSSAHQTRFINCPPSSSLWNISCTPTTENLARRMFRSEATRHASTPSVSSNDSESSFHQSKGPHLQSLARDGPAEQANTHHRHSEMQERVDRDKKDQHLIPSTARDSSIHSSSAFAEDGTSRKIGLISYLPKIPATPTTASEEERLAKWGPNIGPPRGGSTLKNPYNYDVLEAYFEEADHPMFNVAETTRRAGNAAIQTMFDPIYAIPGLDGRIPRGFPLYGFSMREIPTTNLHEILRSYGIEPIEGLGYDVDRKNMAILCTHVGATWLAGVI
ncbi:hypothetical protein AA313_de0206610 [Arthrobotrys entomopaga]|nr:hypothetical protein AA313_de0206610 [Arthrobotrys entomopaga]